MVLVQYGYGMVRYGVAWCAVWHGMWYRMAWYDGTVWWMYFKAKYFLVVRYASVYKVQKSRIRRTNIICNDLTLERTNISSSM